MTARHLLSPVKLTVFIAYCFSFTPPGYTEDAKREGDAEAAGKLPAGVIRLAGSPEEIGRKHGELLRDKIRLMVREYVEDSYAWEQEKEDMLARVRRMKPSIPAWYREELAACAKAAGIEEDVLLFAQCEGDIKSLGGCTAYVAFGKATADGTMEIGRSFDYWGLESTEECAIVLAVVPRPRDGHAFVSVGWAGILGGWTFINEKGLFVANNLGGFFEKNPKGVPTLVLERMVAQKAATVAEAVKIVRETPRMRGQALVIGHPGDKKAGVEPEAVVIQYDGTKVEVEKATDCFASDSSVGTSPTRLRGMLRQAKREPMEVIKSVGNYITLHSVAIRPQEHKMWVAHGRYPSAHRGKYVEYDIRALLRR